MRASRGGSRLSIEMRTAANWDGVAMQTPYKSPLFHGSRAHLPPWRTYPFCSVKPFLCALSAFQWHALMIRASSRIVPSDQVHNIETTRGHRPWINQEGVRDTLSRRLPCSEQVHDAVGDARLLVLRDALADPHDVADLLLAQAHVGIEHAVVELLLERVRQAAHLLLVQHLADTPMPTYLPTGLSLLSIAERALDPCCAACKIFALWGFQVTLNRPCSAAPHNIDRAVHAVTRASRAAATDPTDAPRQVWDTAAMGLCFPGGAARTLSSIWDSP